MATREKPLPIVVHRTELRQVLSFDRTNNCKRAGYWYRTLCSSALRLILCPRRCGVVALRCAAHDRQRQPGTVAALQALALLLLALQPPLLPFPDGMARGCKARSSKASACRGEMLLHQAEQGRRRGDVTRVDPTEMRRRCLIGIAVASRRGG